QLLVDVEGAVGGEGIDLDGVVDDQLHRLLRVDLFRIAAQLRHGIAHGGKVHDSRHAGEILQQHASRHEDDLFVRRSLRVPVGESTNVVGRDRGAVLVAQQILQENAQGVGQAGGVHARLVESL